MAVAAGIMAATAVVGTGASIIQGSNAAAAQKRAAAQAETEATNQRAASERALNAQTAKTPNVASIYANNMTGNAGGVGSTMLTSPAGAAVAPSMLARSTLLGG